MKKIIILILGLIIMSGCEKTINTPTSKVEDLLNQYQNLSPSIIDNLKDSIEKEDMTKEQKKKYESLMEKQYQSLSYKIKNEEIVEDTAVVDVEIEVLNYSYSIANSKKYYDEHREEIKDFNDYKLEQLEKVTDKIKYDLTLNLTRYNGFWELDDIDNNDLEKIHGLSNFFENVS